MQTSVRDRAVAAFRKANPGTAPEKVFVAKSRKRREVIVKVGDNSLRWSYAEGGKLRRI